MLGAHHRCRRWRCLLWHGKIAWSLRADAHQTPVQTDEVERYLLAADDDLRAILCGSCALGGAQSM